MSARTDTVPEIADHTHSRRNVLKAAGILAIGGAAGCAGSRTHARSTDSAEPKPVARGTLRIAHMTDSHVQPERRAAEGLAAAFTHAQGHRPDMILTGGDLVMDSFDADDARTRTQWDIFTRVVQENVRCPIHHCMGNHDIWGWNRPKSGCSGNEPLFGKRRFCDVLGLDRQYYALRERGWKIIVLDTIQPNGDGYVGGLDDAQFEWLKGELTGLPAAEHVLVLSHIPIINISTVLSDSAPKANKWDISGGLMCLDAKRIVSLFAACPNVKAAISGHIHTHEDVTFQGVRYLNNGAVSGNWWKSQEKSRGERAAAGLNVKGWNPLRSDPGYAVLDLHADGRVECGYVMYGWVGEA